MARTIIVTGAASGIGRATAQHLLESGDTVIALDRHFGAESGALQAKFPRQYRQIACDVSRPESVEAAFSDVRAITTSLDALIVCAGILRGGPVVDTSIEDFTALFETNTRGAWLCARQAVPLLRNSAGPGSPARIVFVASIAAVRPKAGAGVYAATKAALYQLARVMAVELAPENILVNVVSPGTTDTPMIQAPVAGKGFKLSGASLLGRIATPDDVVPVIAFLLSDAAAYLAGTNICVDGGTSAAFVG